MNYCTECGKPTDNGMICEDCMVNGSPWLSAMKIKENDLEQKITNLEAENAELRERLGKAVELPVPLGTPILKVWKNRVPEDGTRMSFVDIWEITMANFKLEHFPLWGKFYFPNTEEGKKAALARLTELKGEADG